MVLHTVAISMVHLCHTVQISNIIKYLWFFVTAIHVLPQKVLELGGSKHHLRKYLEPGLETDHAFIGHPVDGGSTPASESKSPHPSVPRHISGRQPLTRLPGDRPCPGSVRKVVPRKWRTFRGRTCENASALKSTSQALIQFLYRSFYIQFFD